MALCLKYCECTVKTYTKKEYEVKFLKRKRQTSEIIFPNMDDIYSVEKKWYY